MMSKFVKIVIAVIMAICLMLLSPLSVGAAGFGVGPAELKITALSGEERQEMMFVKYTNDSSCIVELSAAGDISDWFSFYEPNAPANPIQRLTVPPGEWTYITVKINIPRDAPMDTVIGTIHAQIVSSGGGSEGQSALSLQGKVDVTIEIVGVAEVEEVVAESEEVATEGEEVTAEGGEVAAKDEEVAAEGEEVAAQPASLGLIVGIIVFVVLVAGIGGFIFSRRRTRG